MKQGFSKGSRGWLSRQAGAHEARVQQGFTRAVVEAGAHEARVQQGFTLVVFQAGAHEARKQGTHLVGQRGCIMRIDVATMFLFYDKTRFIPATNERTHDHLKYEVA